MAPTGNKHRKLLKQLSEQLTIGDVGSMKFICRGKIGAASLEKIENDKPHKFLELLQQNGLISSSDLSCLRELFIGIQRFDLATRIPGERSDVVDSCARPPLSRLPSSISPFRSLLKELADELTSTQVDEIKFLLEIPGGLTAKIQDGQSLLVYMEEKGHLSESNLHELKDVLNDVHRVDLIQRIEKFSHGQGESLPQPAVTSPGAASSGAAYTLMRPSDFLMAVNVPPPEEQLPSYPMSSPAGHALIINNEKFIGRTTDGKLLQPRNGTQVDVDNLTDLWNKLNFQVEKYNDLKAHQIMTVVQDMASKTIDNASSCFVCCLLSHGNEGAIYGSDSKTVEICSIMDFFKESRCPALEGKPKLFFIQACRGQNRLTSTSSFPVGMPERSLNADASPPDASPPDASAPPDAAGIQESLFRRSADPNESHFLLGYATPPGFVSWRSSVYGSWYVNALVETFSTYFHQEDVLSMMVKVNERVSKAYNSKGYRQCPAPVVTLTKRIYFNSAPS